MKHLFFDCLTFVVVIAAETKITLKVKERKAYVAQSL